MSPLAGLLVTVALLGVNAFFVAGEFATTSSRRSQIEPLREQGRRGSAKAMYALENVSHMLSICQLGVTVASTTLGAVAEPAIAHLLVGPLTSIGLPASSAHLVGLLTALLLVVFLHVVFGEMVPKNISIAMPQQALLVLAPPLVVIGAAAAPVIHAMDRTADWFVRRAGLTPRSEISATFTAEEVASIVERSEQEGKIHDELGLLSGSLEFTDRTARDAMVPLDELVMVAPGCTPAELEHEVSVTGFSRFPVVEKGTIIGYLHVKDVLYAQGDEHDRPIERERIREMDRVRVDDELEDAMRQMQHTGIHCAEVLDRAGAGRSEGVDAADPVVGVLFLEDIIEELAGEVRDTVQRR